MAIKLFESGFIAVLLIFTCCKQKFSYEPLPSKPPIKQIGVIKIHGRLEALSVQLQEGVRLTNILDMHCLSAFEPNISLPEAKKRLGKQLGTKPHQDFGSALEIKLYEGPNGPVGLCEVSGGSQNFMWQLHCFPTNHLPEHLILDNSICKQVIQHLPSRGNLKVSLEENGYGSVTILMSKNYVEAIILNGKVPP